MKHLTTAVVGALFASSVWATLETPIVIGHTAPLTGPSAVAGAQLREGVDVAIKEQNAKGGINGRKVEMVSLNDEHNAQITASNVKELSEKHNAIVVVSTFGNAQSIAAAKQAEIQKIPLIGPASGVETLRSTSFNYVFNVRAGYAREAKKIVDHLYVATNPNKQLVLVYANSVYGQDVKTLILSELAQKKIGAPIEIMLDLKTSERMAAMAIAKAKATDVVIAANFESIVRLKQELATLAFNPQIATLSYVGPIDPEKATMAKMAGLAITQVMPDPDEVYIRFVKDYQLAMKQHSRETMSHNSLESYISTRVGLEAMKKISGAITADKLYESLSKFKVDFGGYKIDYTVGSGSRAGSNFCEITAVARDGRLIH